MSFLTGGGGDQTVKTKFPSWYSAAAKNVLGSGNIKTNATEIANRPYVAYPGKTVAGQDPFQTQAYDFTQGQLGQAGGQIESFLPGLQGLAANFDPGQVTAGQFAGTDMAPYMNPYIQHVVDTSMAELDRQRQQAIQQGQAAAQQAGAYGGSRHGVADAQTNEAFARQAGQLESGLYSQGYQQATGLAMGDIENALKAAQANQQAGLDAARIRASAAAQGISGAQAAQQANLQSAAALQAAGTARQQQKQAILSDRYNRWLERRNYPIDQLNVVLQALGQIPVNKSQVTSGGSSSPLMGLLGGASAGASIAQALGGAAGPSAALGGGATGIGAILGALSLL